MVDPTALLQPLKIAADREYRALVEEAEQTLGARLDRFRDVRFCFADYRKPADFGQAPFFRHYPDLEAKPWWSLSDYPAEVRGILQRFETEYATLKDEFEAGIAKMRGAFAGAETGYFGVATSWLSYTMVTEAGQPVPEGFAAFPKLAGILTELIERHFVAKSYFALMLNGTHLEPHCGGQNSYLRMHYALRIPPGDAAMRVGGEQRPWENGKLCFFDDTFVHEAWNRTGLDRYILLVRLMHPAMSPVERKAFFLVDEKFMKSKTFLALDEIRKKMPGPKD